MFIVDGEDPGFACICTMFIVKLIVSKCLFWWGRSWVCLYMYYVYCSTDCFKMFIVDGEDPGLLVYVLCLLFNWLFQNVYFDDGEDPGFACKGPGKVHEFLIQ